MSRFVSHSSRRLLAVAALVTATAVPSVLVIGQSAAGANGLTATVSTTTPSTMVTNGGHMH